MFGAFCSLRKMYGKDASLCVTSTAMNERFGPAGGASLGVRAKIAEAVGGVPWLFSIMLSRTIAPNVTVAVSGVTGGRLL